MKKTLTGLACGLAFVASAHAEMRTYEYTAQITTMNANSTPLDSSTLPGFDIHIGDTLSGRFNFDTKTSVDTWDPIDWEIGDDGYPTKIGGIVVSYWGWGSTNSLKATFDKNGHTLETVTPTISLYEPQIIVRNVTAGSDADSFEMRTSGDGEQMTIQLADKTGTTLADNHSYNHLNLNMPTTSQMDAFSERSFEYVFVMGNQRLVLDGGITSLRLLPVSAVPEADTYAMLLAGLGLLAWQRKRRNPIQG